MRLEIPLLFLGCSLLPAQETAISRMFDAEKTAAQRNDACFELRGAQSPEVIQALRKAIAIDRVRSCVAQNLREAGAVEELKSALDEAEPEVRAAAARELGLLARPELAALLAKAAHDENLLVASNAVYGLAQYRDPMVLPHFLELAAGKGLIAAMALGHASRFDDPRVVKLARGMLANQEVTMRLAAIQVIRKRGDASDLPHLRQLASVHEEVSAGGRGFGLVPGLDLSRAAQQAITEISSRQ